MSRLADEECRTESLDHPVRRGLSLWSQQRGEVTLGVVRDLYCDLAVIRSFADSKTRRLFEAGRRRGFRGLDYGRALLLLDTLDAAPSLDSLRELRSVRLHALSGTRKGTSSMTINARWRLTFRFASGDVVDVAIEDYHKG